MGPAARGEGVTAYVETDGDSIAMLGNHLRAPLGLFERRSTEVDSCTASCEGRCQRFVIANAAAKFDLDFECSDDLGE